MRNHRPLSAESVLMLLDNEPVEAIRWSLDGKNTIFADLKSVHAYIEKTSTGTRFFGFEDGLNSFDLHFESGSPSAMKLDIIFARAQSFLSQPENLEYSEIRARTLGRIT